MYIKTESKGRRVVTIREVRGDRLEAPIVVEFSEQGIAHVKDGVGDLLLDLFPALSFWSEDDDGEEDTEDPDAEPDEEDNY